MAGARIGSVKLYDPPAADPDGLTMGLVQATFVVGTENQSNWWPVCEMPIDVSEDIHSHSGSNGRLKKRTYNRFIITRLINDFFPFPTSEYLLKKLMLAMSDYNKNGHVD